MRNAIRRSAATARKAWVAIGLSIFAVAMSAVIACGGTDLDRYPDCRSGEIGAGNRHSDCGR